MRDVTWRWVVVALALAGCQIFDAHPTTGAAVAPTPPQYQGPLAARVVPIVDAPLDLRPELLGVPLGDDFEPLTGGAGSLFPYARVTYQTLDNVTSERRVLRDRNELKASLHVWRIPIGLSASHTSSHSYAFYRAVQITGVSQLDDSTTPMVPSPSPDARYYAAQIFYGYSYVVRLEGDESALDGAIGFSLAQYAAASVGGLRNHYSFTANMSARGLVPNVADGGAGVDPLFAPSEQVAVNYHRDGTPVPILVEYKEIPSRDNPVRRLQVDFSGLQIAKTGVLGLFGRCGYWTMNVECMVNGAPVVTGALLASNKVCPGPTGVGRPGLVVSATDQDVIECFVSGHYSRERHEAALGSGTTGRIVVGRISPSLTGPMSVSAEADTAYSMTWTLTRLP